MSTIDEGDLKRFAKLKLELGDEYPDDWPKIPDEYLMKMPAADHPQDAGGVKLLPDAAAPSSPAPKHESTDLGLESGGVRLDLNPEEPAPATQSPNVSSLPAPTAHPALAGFLQKPRACYFEPLPEEIVPAGQGAFAIERKLMKLQKNDLVDSSQTFCPILVISRLPYKFVPRKDQARVFSAFFSGLEFWNRNWHLYYIWPQEEVARHAMILVSELQVKQFLAEINRHLDLKLEMPEDAAELGLSLTFPDHPLLRPRYLGRSLDADDFLRLKRSIPSDEDLVELAQSEFGRVPRPPQDVVDEWKEMMKQAYKLNNRNVSTSTDLYPLNSKGQNKADKRAARESAWKSDLKRTEQLLGFRYKHDKSTLPEPGLDASWDEIREWQAGRKAPDPRPILTHFAAPYHHPRQPVFLSIDVECYEKDHGKVTEIGVAMLDSKELGSLPPGDRGVHWQDKMRARHFRIKEHAHLRNGEHVNDAADDFMFGGDVGSEFVALADVPKTLANTFRPPFCAHTNPGDDVDAITSAMENLDPSGTPERRYIILVGHDIMNDINHLSKIGFEPTTMGGVEKIIDTADIYRGLAGQWDPPNLGDMLLEFDLEPWELHNAGNDAMYTLWAMVAVALQSAMTRPM